MIVSRFIVRVNLFILITSCNQCCTKKIPFWDRVFGQQWKFNTTTNVLPIRVRLVYLFLYVYLCCSVTKERTEIILQGTRNNTIYGNDVFCEEYEFKCKPGSVKRRPCLISPYHYRLDWLMWFAAFQVNSSLVTRFKACYKLALTVIVVI